MKQIKVINPVIESKEDLRIGWYDVVIKSLEDNVNEFLATISKDNIIDIDYRQDECIITYINKE